MVYALLRGSKGVPGFRGLAAHGLLLQSLPIVSIVVPFWGSVMGA